MAHAVIIGAGVIGLCAARELRARGWDVTIVDGRRPGAGASHGNAGWIVPSLSGPVPAPGLIRTSLRWMLRPESPLYIKPRPDLGFARWILAFWRHCTATAFDEGLAATATLNQRTFALFDALEADGLDFEQQRDGLLHAYVSPEALEHDLRGLEPLRPFGYAMPAMMDGAAMRDREPALSERISGGFPLERERHVRPDRLVAALVAYLTEHGVEIRSETPVNGFAKRPERVAGVETPGETIPADAVVIAAGAWSGQIARLAGARVPIEAGKGYSLDYQPLPRPVRTPLYLHEARVAVTPFRDSVRLAGTMELSGLNETIRPARVAAIARAAATCLRDWPDDPARASTVWTGMRPMTPDGLPAIGMLPGYGNVAIASGHAMLGVTLAPATGEAIAELLTSGRAPAVLAPFDPARFGRR